MRYRQSISFYLEKISHQFFGLRYPLLQFFNIKIRVRQSERERNNRTVKARVVEFGHSQVLWRFPISDFQRFPIFILRFAPFEN